MSRPVKAEGQGIPENGHLHEENADSGLDDDDEEGQKGDKKRMFYADPNPLLEPLRTWRRELKIIWLEDKTTKTLKIRDYLFSVVFAESTNPFDAALTLMKRSPDYTTQRPNSLSGTVLRELEVWLDLPTTKKTALYDEFVDEATQIRAFKIGTAKHTCHLDVIVRVFQLNISLSDGIPSIKEQLVPLIHDMIQDCKFKDAMNCAHYLKLQSSFALEQLIVPCMLQDRTIPTELYVADNKELQREMVVYFDELLATRFDLNRFIDKWKQRGVTGVHKEKWQGKTLQKLVGRLLKTFDLPSELAPNLQRNRTEGTIRHVCYKRFSELSQSEANFSDYVEDLIGLHPEMKLYFLEQLVHYKQFEEAAKWVVKFNYQNSHMPLPLFRYMNAHPESWQHVAASDSASASGSQPAVVDDTPKVALLALPDHVNRSVRIVDDRKGLADCVDRIFGSSASNGADDELVIGLDTEWRPLFLCSNEQVALIQIATKDCAFLIDVLALENVLSEQEWIDFFDQLLCTDEALKLGFDFAGDLRTIAQTLPFCRDILSRTKNVVCLVQLVRNLCRLNSSIAEALCASKDGEKNSNENHDLSTASSSTGDCSLDRSIADSVDSCAALAESLSPQSQNSHTSQLHFKLTDLCVHLLGGPLDKSEQFGNWAKRPLRPEQVHYAAMDAYCQIEIFNKLKSKAQELLIDWGEVVARSTVGISTGTKAEHKKIRSRQPKKKMDDAEFRQLIQRFNAATLRDGEKTQSPKDVRVVVDSMIRGLGKHLRRCGVDTLIAEDGRSAKDTLVKLAREERRFVLTSGKAFMALCPRIPNNIVCVPAHDESSPLSQLAFVLKHFRVHIREEDIFSRCIVCNCARFLFVPTPVLSAMHDAIVVTRDPFNPKPFDKTAAIAAINAIDTTVYEGYGAVVQTDAKHLLVECDGGCLDVERGVIVDSWTTTEVDGIALKQPVKVKVESLFPNSFVPGRVFFVCFDCGKVYWDGSHISNYMTTYGETVLGKESDSVTESP